MSGKQLKIIRNYLGKTQKDFSALLGVGRSYLSQMENEHKPISDRVKISIAKEVEITPEFLISIERIRNILNS